MRIIESGYFHYENGALYCEDVPVEQIIENSSTPAYIYSKKFFRDRYEEFSSAFSSVKHTIFYAAKANFNLSVIRTFVDMGSGVDVNSEGEFYRALKAGANPKNIILTGVGKTPDEIKLGIEHDLLMIKAESAEEIYLINDIAASLGKTAPVAVRVNPDVNPNTHPYISTGLAENKFGIDTPSAMEIFKDYKKLKNIKFTGLDMHIGSQITTIDPFAEAVDKLSEIFFEVKSMGINLRHFDMGGGIGVVYNNENPFSITDFAEALIPKLKKLDCDIFFEPGRFLTANGGILVTKALYTKNNTVKNFIVVDGAMTDMLRPSIYGAYHHIQPVRIAEDRSDIEADVVGPVCESGDFLAKNREITEVKQGELLALLSAGSYGMVMSSNYNSRRRPPEILVDGKSFSVVRSRETFDHLLYDEK